MTFGERLKLLRLEKDLTQIELGKQFNLGKTAISLYENNERFPDKETLDKMADFFGCSVDYLLGRTDLKSIILESYTEAIERQRIKDSGKEELVIGLSRENKGILTDEDKEEITKFAEYVANRRKGSDNKWN